MKLSVTGSISFRLRAILALFIAPLIDRLI